VFNARIAACVEMAKQILCRYRQAVDFFALLLGPLTCSRPVVKFPDVSGALSVAYTAPNARSRSASTSSDVLEACAPPRRVFADARLHHRLGQQLAVGVGRRAVGQAPGVDGLDPAPISAPQ